MVQKKKGFTLIELLVVISIIAMLLAILMPALGKVKEKAKAVVCRANLKQLSLALNVYTVDNNNKALLGDGGKDFWFLQIAPYMGEASYSDNPEDNLEGSMRVLYCPSTKEPIFDNWGTSETRWRYHVNNFGSEGSYGINSWVGGWADNPIVLDNPGDSWRTSSSSVRSDVPFFSDSAWVGAAPFDTNRVPADLSLADASSQWLYGMGRVCMDRHSMAINVVFADNHAEQVKLEDLWKLRWSKSFQRTEVEVPRSE